MVEEPSQRRPLIPEKEIILEAVTSSAAPQSTFFIPRVDTKGCGRCSLVNSSPFTMPTRVPVRSATTIRTKELVTPLVTRNPHIQAAKVALAPTERSMPAVIRQSSIPVDRRALKVVCFKIDIILSNFRKFGDAKARITKRMSSAPNVPA